MPIERFITGVETLVAFLGLLVLLGVQLRLGPRDRQERSAFFFVAATAAIVGQLSLSYLGGPPLGESTRGNVSYALWVGSIVWFAYCTIRHNRKMGSSVRWDR
jgi:hypothetical protein